MSERKAKYNRRSRLQLIKETFRFTQKEVREREHSDQTMKFVLAMSDHDFIKFMMDCARKQAIKEITTDLEEVR